jgi:hypothetical protein
MLFKKLFSIAAATLFLTTLAWAAAQLEISDIVINRNMDGNGVEGLNIRVDVTNDGTLKVFRPEVRLYSRSDWQSDWRLIKRFDIHEEIKPDQKLSHDYFAYGSGYVDPSLFNKSFEVKAEVWAGNKLMAQKKTSYSDPK